MHLRLPFWQRLLLTIAAMLAASWIAGLLWHYIFSFPLPSFAAGMVGGLAALLCWEFLKRFGHLRERKPCAGTKGLFCSRAIAKYLQLRLAEILRLPVTVAVR